MGKNRVAKKFNKNFQEYMREDSTSSKQGLSFGFDRSITKKVKKVQRKIKKKSKKLEKQRKLAAASAVLANGADIEVGAGPSSYCPSAFIIHGDTPVVASAPSTVTTGNCLKTPEPPLHDIDVACLHSTENKNSENANSSDSLPSETVNITDVQETGPTVAVDSDEDHLLVNLKDSLFIDFDDDTAVTPGGNTGSQLKTSNNHPDDSLQGMSSQTSGPEIQSTGVRDSPITLDPKLEPFNSVLSDTEDEVSDVRLNIFGDSDDSVDFLLDSVKDENRYKCPFPGNPFNVFLLPKTPLIDVLRSMCSEEGTSNENCDDDDKESVKTNESFDTNDGTAELSSSEETSSQTWNGQSQINETETEDNYREKRRKSVDINEGDDELSSPCAYQMSDTCDDRDDNSKLINILSGLIEAKKMEYFSLLRKGHGKRKTSKVKCNAQHRMRRWARGLSVDTKGPRAARKHQGRMKRWATVDEDNKIDGTSVDTSASVAAENHQELEEVPPTRHLGIEICLGDISKSNLTFIIKEAPEFKVDNTSEEIYAKTPEDTLQDSDYEQLEIDIGLDNLDETGNEEEQDCLNVTLNQTQTEKCDLDAIEQDTNAQECNLHAVELLKKTYYLGSEISDSDIKCKEEDLAEAQQQQLGEQIHGCNMCKVCTDTGNEKNDDCTTNSRHL